MEAGVWPGAQDIVGESGLRSSVMLSFTAQNPKVCLQPDDIEAINLLYPVCTGRAMVRDTQEAWRCNKSDAHIGVVRVLVYIFVPVLLIHTLLTLLFSCLRHYRKRAQEGVRLATIQAKLLARESGLATSVHEERASIMATALEQQVHAVRLLYYDVGN